jgi:RES domain-containing protein
MIVTQLDRLTAYRAHLPKWASMPSGAQASATRGGRVNRPGIEARYFALDVKAAIGEYRQISTLLPPSTFVTYQIRVASVIDFREGLTPFPYTEVSSPSSRKRRNVFAAT